MKLSEGSGALCFLIFLDRLDSFGLVTWLSLALYIKAPSNQSQMRTQSGIMLNSAMGIWDDGSWERLPMNEGIYTWASGFSGSWIVTR